MAPVKPEGGGENRHIYFGSDTTDEEAVGLEFFLDNVEGLGPERLRLQDPPAGDYLLAAVYYDDLVNNGPKMGEVEVELEPG